MGWQRQQQGCKAKSSRGLKLVCQIHREAHCEPVTCWPDCTIASASLHAHRLISHSSWSAHIHYLWWQQKAFPSSLLLSRRDRDHVWSKAFVCDILSFQWTGRTKPRAGDRRAGRRPFATWEMPPSVITAVIFFSCLPVPHLPKEQKMKNASSNYF